MLTLPALYRAPGELRAFYFNCRRCHGSAAVATQQSSERRRPPPLEQPQDPACPSSTRAALACRCSGPPDMLAGRGHRLPPPVAPHAPLPAPRRAAAGARPGGGASPAAWASEAAPGPGVPPRCHGNRAASREISAPSGAALRWRRRVAAWRWLGGGDEEAVPAPREAVRGKGRFLGRYALPFTSGGMISMKYCNKVNSLFAHLAHACQVNSLCLSLLLTAVPVKVSAKGDLSHHVFLLITSENCLTYDKRI